MKIRTPLPARQTRLEIIPLIDIMFFLLASFMMISLQMQIVRTLKANLPTATQATSTKNLTVNRDGQVLVDDKTISFVELNTLLTNRLNLNTNLPVYITGARDATHGEIVGVLDLVKRAGIQHVAIAVKIASDQP